MEHAADAEPRHVDLADLLHDLQHDVADAAAADLGAGAGAAPLVDAAPAREIDLEQFVGLRGDLSNVMANVLTVIRYNFFWMVICLLVPLWIGSTLLHLASISPRELSLQMVLHCRYLVGLLQGQVIDVHSAYQVLVQHPDFSSLQNVTVAQLNDTVASAVANATNELGPVFLNQTSWYNSTFALLSAPCLSSFFAAFFSNFSSLFVPFRFRLSPIMVSKLSQLPPLLDNSSWTANITRDLLSFVGVPLTPHALPNISSSVYSGVSQVSFGLFTIKIDMGELIGLYTQPLFQLGVVVMLGYSIMVMGGISVCLALVVLHASRRRPRDQRAFALPPVLMPDPLMGHLERMAHSAQLLLAYVAMGFKTMLVVLLELWVFPLLFGAMLDFLLLDYRRSASFFRAPLAGMFLHWAIGLFFMVYVAFIFSLLKKNLRVEILNRFFRFHDDPLNVVVVEMIRMPLTQHLHHSCNVFLFYFAFAYLGLHVPTKIAMRFPAVFLPFHARFQREEAPSLHTDIFVFHFVIPFVISRFNVPHYCDVLVKLWFKHVTPALGLSHLLLHPPAHPDAPAPLPQQEPVVLAPAVPIAAPANAASLAVEPSSTVTVLHRVGSPRGNNELSAHFPSAMTSSSWAFESPREHESESESEEEKADEPPSLRIRSPMAEVEASESRSYAGAPSPRMHIENLPSTSTTAGGLPCAIDSHVDCVRRSSSCSEQHVHAPLAAAAHNNMAESEQKGASPMNTSGGEELAQPNTPRRGGEGPRRLHLIAEVEVVDQVVPLPPTREPLRAVAEPDGDGRHVGHYRLRVFLLIVLAWITHMVLVIVATVMPLAAGRTVLMSVSSAHPVAAKLSRLTQNDLYSYVIGSGLFYLASNACMRVAAFVIRHTVPETMTFFVSHVVLVSLVFFVTLLRVLVLKRPSYYFFFFLFFCVWAPSCCRQQSFRLLDSFTWRYFRSCLVYWRT